MIPLDTATPIKTSPADFQLIPAVTVIRTDSRKTAREDSQQGSPTLKASLDARWVLRPDLEWSATVDPNFSQVAPDVLQLSANRQFAVLYQENRPFFEQGTQVFNTPSMRFSTDTFNPSGALVDTLTITDPRFATKLVGQVGADEIGALATEDTATSIVLPGPQGSTTQSFDFNTQDELLRYRYDVGDSAIGLYALRPGRWRLSQRSVRGRRRLADRSERCRDRLRRLLEYRLSGQRWRAPSGFPRAPSTVISGASTTPAPDATTTSSVNLSHVAEGFRADLGYMPQVGYDQGAFLGEYDFYAPDAGLVAELRLRHHFKLDPRNRRRRESRSQGQALHACSTPTTRRRSTCTRRTTSSITRASSSTWISSKWIPPSSR